MGKAMNIDQVRQPVFFVSHGGGPWPWIDTLKKQYVELERSLSQILESLVKQPKAILMISAHWEESVFTVQGAERPTMLYDYSGFPRDTYEIKYTSSGSRDLSTRVVDILKAANIDVAIDMSRGYDHGMFAPMQVINPKADIPVVQLSLKKGLDPITHIELGRQLAALRDENILIIASGLTYHNLAHFNFTAEKQSALFDDWLGNTLLNHEGQSRNMLLCDWKQAPAARFAHPREEHLLPIMVAVGAAENEKARRNYHETNFLGGIHVSGFMFG